MVVIDKFTPQPLHYGERPPSMHYIGGCVGPRTGLDTGKKRVIFWPCRETNPISSVLQFGSWVLCQQNLRISCNSVEIRTGSQSVAVQLVWMKLSEDCAYSEMDVACDGPISLVALSTGFYGLRVNQLIQKGNERLCVPNRIWMFVLALYCEGRSYCL